MGAGAGFPVASASGGWRREESAARFSLSADGHAHASLHDHGSAAALEVALLWPPLPDPLPHEFAENLNKMEISVREFVGKRAQRRNFKSFGWAALQCFAARAEKAIRTPSLEADCPEAEEVRA
jgi:hypothetical protein